jgi:hypothetical protein
MTMTTVPGQGGPCYTINETSGLAALDAILETPGARRLVVELYMRMILGLLAEDPPIAEDPPTVAVPTHPLPDLAALDSMLKERGCRNLIGELHRRSMARPGLDVAELFDIRTAGMALGPRGVIKSLIEASEYGTADNNTFHFAMTAVVYAMALEKLDPDFFPEKKFLPPQDRNGYEVRRQEIKEYVTSKLV